jgi:dipeptidyl aminopeptidase/acylaminoacyl peptidase
MYLLNPGNFNRAKGVCIVALLILISTATLAAQRPMTLEDIARLRSVGSAAIAPDGGMIAYTLSVPRNPFVEDNGSVWVELHVASINSGTRPFVTGEVRVSNVAFTPDGRFVTYLAERGEDTVKSLYAIAVDGGESRRLLQFGSSISGYSWAPDSRRIAFLARDTVPTELKELRDKGFNQQVYEEDWRHTRVWIYDIHDSTTPPASLPIEGTASVVRWSPEGTMLAVVTQPTPSVDDRLMFRSVSLVAVGSGELIRAYEKPGKLGRLAFSPDGAQVAFITGADINDPAAGEVVIASVDSDELQPVITNFDGHVWDIAFSDNKTIVFLAAREVHTFIGTVHTDGSKQRAILAPGRPVMTAMKLATDGRSMALLGSNYNYPKELFSYRLGDSAPERLTNSNPWLDEIQFAEQTVVEHIARDGLRLQGILIHPLNERPGTRYPLVLAVHGGPESHRRDDWLTRYSSPGQVLTAQGYAVFYPNYRGSTGRGVEFSKMGQADYADGEFNDLVDAVDHLVKIGLIDRKKVGITGGSYGGYATAWGATALTEHFACGVMAVGISDLISKFGTTDIPQEMFLVHARRWPWDHWQWYLERSPIYYAGKANTPLLIVHGEDDTRVHPSQSMELYRYLKTVGQAPVRLVFYKEEGHGNRKAAARYDFSRRLIRWMDHYLKGSGGEPPQYELDYSALEAAGGK